MSKLYRAGLYARLSKDDGDKPESDSILNQLNLLQQFCACDPQMQIVRTYIDDGFTGTHFERPGFQSMMADMHQGSINCIIVKDLSRFGRDYIDTGAYLERIFPEQGVRFIAVNDQIDSNRGPYDMLLPLKNIFNAQYAKDISAKIRGALHTKQVAGEFIGAFCSYGYRKDPNDHNRLIIDQPAAQTVQRIFNLFEQGRGKQSIARILNDADIPCPSEYKRLMGERYRNGRKLDATTYWTYSTISRILSNQIYAGDMVQAKCVRRTMHGKAQRQAPAQWIVAYQTHPAIITGEQWARVQAQLKNSARTVDFSAEQNPFYGYIKCGDCGRGMQLRAKGKRAYYSCGSYERYGSKACSKHSIYRRDLERIVLADLNLEIAGIQNLRTLCNSAPQSAKQTESRRDWDDVRQALQRMQSLKKAVYEDHKDGLLNREDYLAYRQDYAQKERKLNAQLASQNRRVQHRSAMAAPWAKELLETGRLRALDRATIAETIQSICVYEQGILEITYRFPGQQALPKPDLRLREMQEP